MTRTANEFLTPQAIKVEAASGTSAKVILEPLERGFGHTGQCFTSHPSFFFTWRCCGRS